MTLITVGIVVPGLYRDVDCSKIRFKDNYKGNTDL